SAGRAVASVRLPASWRAMRRSCMVTDEWSLRPAPNRHDHCGSSSHRRAGEDSSAPERTAELASPASLLPRFRVRSLSPTWLALSAVSLSLTLHISDGFYHAGALTGLGATLVLSVLGVAGVPWPWAAGRTSTADARGAALASVLGLGVLASALALVTSPLARYMADPRPRACPTVLAPVPAI